MQSLLPNDGVEMGLCQTRGDWSYDYTKDEVLVHSL